jgi:hypothetical protein
MTPVSIPGKLIPENLEVLVLPLHLEEIAYVQEEAPAELREAA